MRQHDLCHWLSRVEAVGNAENNFAVPRHHFAQCERFDVTAIGTAEFVDDKEADLVNRLNAMLGHLISSPVGRSCRYGCIEKEVLAGNERLFFSRSI